MQVQEAIGSRKSSINKATEIASDPFHDEAAAHEDDVLVAVTTFCFDISVLECQGHVRYSLHSMYHIPYIIHYVVYIAAPPAQVITVSLGILP